jgi:hypothetical protein
MPRSGDNIQLVWATDHHESGGSPPSELADATTADLQTPVGGQRFGPLPGPRRGGCPVGRQTDDFPADGLLQEVIRVEY